MKKSMVVVTMAALIISSASAWAAGAYKDTIHVPVTIWDFHSDRSNPEFEREYRNGLHTGMVATTLDANRHPILGPRPFFSNEIARWFVPWTPGNFTIPTYTLTNGDAGFVSTGLTTVNYDTAFKNIRIDTFLVFNYVQGSAGTYEYINNAFFPIDDRGFGKEGNPHNYCFTMELHWTFVKTPGLTFNFTGDDDVWAFLNGRLVMDLGGIHGPEAGAVNVDTIAGLIDGQRYAFDFFSAERHVTGSVIRITTNIISAAQRIGLRAIPSDTIRAGDTVTITGTVFGVDGRPLTRESDSIVWTQGRANVQQGDRVLVAMNDTTRFTATVAHRRVAIVATYRNATTTIQDTVWITIVPNVPEQVDIVRQSRTPLSATEAFAGVTLTTGSPRMTVMLDSSLPTMYLYAALRDRYGNLIGPAHNAAWKSMNTDTATVAAAQGKLFEALVTRATDAWSGTTFIIASIPSLAIADTAIVMLSRMTSPVVIRTIPNPAVASKITINGSNSNMLVEVVGPKRQSTVVQTVRAQGKGSVIAIEGITVPPNPLDPVRMNVKIYDVNGNSVAWIENPNLFNGQTALPGSSVYLFWNGFNQKGMKVAPGVYRAVIYVDYPASAGIRDIRSIARLGIRQ